MRVHLKIASVGLAAALLVAASAFVGGGSAGATPNVLHVRVVGLPSSSGTVHCTLFNIPSAFPSDGSKALSNVVAAIATDSASCDFNGIAPGKYAVVAFHDANGNGKFDRNFIGMPLEGYAFSNNVKPRFSAPDFDQCSFDYRGGDQSITMQIIPP